MVANLVRYLEIKEEIQKRIREKSWQPGDTLPSEVQLAEQFSCARATVSKALSELSDQGIIERHPFL